MGSYLPYGLEPQSAQHVADRYVEIIDGLLQDQFNDYIDNLSYDATNPNTFKLEFIPPQGSMKKRNIRLFINGVLYTEGYFNYDVDTNSITWVFTFENSGFELKPFYRYTAVYDVREEDNGDVMPTRV